MVNLIGFVLFLIIMIGVGVMYLRQKKSATVEEKEPETMQDLLGVSDIRGGVLSVGPSRHCKIIAVGAINYYLLSPDERLMIDNAFGALLASLNFPVQLYVQTRLLDLTGAINELDESIKRAPDSLKPYGYSLKNYLQEWIRIRSVMIRNPYFIIICENNNYVEARRELEHRQQLVIEGLSRCGLTTRVLNDQEIADLFYAIYNSKTRALIAPLKGALNSSIYVKRKEGDGYGESAKKKTAVG